MNLNICEKCEDAHKKDKSGCDDCMNIDVYKQIIIEVDNTKKDFSWMTIQYCLLIIIYIGVISLFLYLMYLDLRL